jgi:hypothetical protein
VCLISTLFSAYSQNTINGTVIDKNGNFPISYATIVVKDGDKITTGAITDDNGFFEIKNLDPKNYSVEIQFMGYKTHFANADLSGSQRTVALGRIILADDAVQLDDVNVVIERSTIEQKIDRKVINVGRDLTTAGATASEIMNNIPSVNVDQDGKLSLRGNENVRVLIDGRPTNIDPAQLLKQIPSTSIKKIELITNPSAKYNPEGMSGIINIVLHKNANDGFNASINSSTTIAQEPKSNNSVNMNYRVRKVNFFGTYGNTIGKYLNTGDISRLDEEASRQLLDIVNDSRSHLYKIGMDYYINDKNTISVYTNQNYVSGDWGVDTNILYPDASQNLLQRAVYFSDTRNGAYNLAYKRLFAKEGETLDLEINFADYVEDQISFFNTDFSNPAMPDSDYSDDIIDKRLNSTVNLDYVNPLNDKTNLELGVESRTARTENIYVSDNSAIPNTNYKYDLDIYSAYATFGQKFEKTSYQIGARFESYNVEATLNGANAYKDDYITVYPSASFTYSPTEKNMFQLSYSRRVDRPSLEQTSVIREFSTPMVTSVGNPELDPQFTSSVELNYTRTLEKGSVTAGVFVRRITNEINRIIYLDPENTSKQIMTFDNFDNNTAFGFEVSANYKINTWWDVQPSVDYSNVSQKGLVSVKTAVPNVFDFVEKEVSVSAFNARLNSNFKATQNLRFLLFGFYRGDVERIQFHNQEMYKIDAGARYSMMNDKLTASVRFNDIFNTMKAEFEGEDPFPSHGEFRWESQSVFFGINYMFGSGKNRALQRKQREENTNQGGGGMF